MIRFCHILAILTSFERYGHLLGDTGIITQLAVWATGTRHTRNRHPAAICYPPICKECFVLAKSECCYLLQFIHTWCGPNMMNIRCLYTAKFALEVAYRETHPPFWDVLISRFRHPMTNGDYCMIGYIFMYICAYKIKYFQRMRCSW